MKKCEYCGGNAESGCGAVETAAGLYLHYSKIECAEVLKLQVEELQKYVQATEYWKIEPHDQKERAAWIQRLALKRVEPSQKICVCGHDYEKHRNIQGDCGDYTPPQGWCDCRKWRERG